MKDSVVTMLSKAFNYETSDLEQVSIGIIIACAVLFWVWMQIKDPPNKS